MSDPIKCDFDGAPNPRWRYSARDFESMGVLASQGGWYACDECAALIERGEREALAVRVVDALIVEHPSMAAKRDWCLATATMVQGDFFKNRTGPVRADRAGEGPIHA